MGACIHGDMLWPQRNHSWGCAFAALFATAFALPLPFLLLICCHASCGPINVGPTGSLQSGLKGRKLGPKSLAHGSHKSAAQQTKHRLRRETVGNNTSKTAISVWIIQLPSSSDCRRVIIIAARTILHAWSPPAAACPGTVTKTMCCPVCIHP